MAGASFADGIVSGRRSLPPRVSDAALRSAKLHDASVTVGEISAFLADDHVHMAVLLGTDGELLTTVERSDLTFASAPEPALRYGKLEGRTVGPHEALHRVWETMLAESRRRLAVIDANGRLVGLLCLKRHGQGFCSESDVRRRACSR
jgi:CBS domain-containing protein